MRPLQRNRWLGCVLGALRGNGSPTHETLFRSLGLMGFAHALSRREGKQPSALATGAYMAALANNMPLRRAMKDAACALDNAGVQAIVYKGQEYLDRIYGDLGARPMADVDLLVRERDAERAEAALLGAGFVVDEACQTMHERKFVKGGMAIDVHRSLLQSLRMAVPHEELFERAQPCKSAPGLWVLDATDALLVHCIAQTVKAYCLPASSFVELQALLAAADAERALALATRWHAASAFYASMRALGALGNEQARALAARVPLSRARRLCLDAIVAGFALRALATAPRRAVLLALKAALIDDLRHACRFIPQWFVFQIAGPRAPAAP